MHYERVLPWQATWEHEAEQGRDTTDRVRDTPGAGTWDPKALC